VLRQNSKVKPRIGITYSDEIKVEPYADAVRASGGEPVTIAPGDGASLDGLEALILAGGVDVSPSLYGEERAPETEAPNEARDRLEQDILAIALQRDLPVLAICRGMQLLNISYKGSLTQHMTGHEIRTADKSLPAHPVQIATSSRLDKIIRTETLPVNSRHHQAIARLGEGLVASARGKDGIIEAIEDPAHRFVLGVQWHPEDMAAVSAVQKLLFDALINETKK